MTAPADAAPKWIVTVEFTVDPRFQPEFMQRLIQQAADSLGEEGCLQFDVCVDPSAPHRVFLYEVYSHREAFATHLATAHFARFDAATRASVTSKSVREWRLYGHDDE